MFGAQVGYRFPFSDCVKLTVAGTYFNFDGVQGYNPFFGGSSFGNTTTTSAAVCSRTLAAGDACLLSDFDIIEGFADLTTSVGGRPLRFFVDYAQNTEAEVNPVAGEKLDTAYVRGHQLRRRVGGQGHLGIRRDLPAGGEGRAVRPAARFGLRRWQHGHEGFVLRGGYTVARNWTLNAALFLNDLSNDVPQSVTVFNKATPAPVRHDFVPGIIDRDYKRLQLDLNFRF